MFTLEMEKRRNRRRNLRSSGGSGRDSGGDDSGSSGNSGGSASTGSDSPGIQDEEMRETNPVARITYAVARFTNVHTDSTLEDMRKLFRRFGRIRGIGMFRDIKGNFLGESEVVYQRNSNAHKAATELHYKDFKGRPLYATIVEVYCTPTQRGSSRTNYTPDDSEIGSVPETGKGKGKKRKKSPDEEEDDPDSGKTTKQLRGIKIG